MSHTRDVTHLPDAMRPGTGTASAHNQRARIARAIPRRLCGGLLALQLRIVLVHERTDFVGESQ